MNDTLIKALVVLVPAVMLLVGSLALFRHSKTTYPLLQLLGAASLVVVVLTHIFEALHAFPSMGWGQENSSGHYVDLCSAVVAATLFPTAICFTRSERGCDVPRCRNSGVTQKEMYDPNGLRRASSANVNALQQI